jgi:hypothetical protein
MLLTIAALVFSARSIDFLLVRINTTKVIRVLSPPLLVGSPLLLAATVRLTTGLLPLLESRMGMKPATTERTPPPQEHVFSSSEHLEGEANTAGGEEKRKEKGKGYRN